LKIGLVGITLARTGSIFSLSFWVKEQIPCQNLQQLSWTKMGVIQPAELRDMNGCLHVVQEVIATTVFSTEMFQNFKVGPSLKNLWGGQDLGPH
jgi:hypothetical protein